MKQTIHATNKIQKLIQILIQSFNVDGNISSRGTNVPTNPRNAYIPPIIAVVIFDIYLRLIHICFINSPSNLLITMY